MKKHKALFISDIHMSNHLPLAVPSDNGSTDRLNDQLKLWDQVTETAREEKVSKVIIPGDLFDKSRVDAVTLAETCRALTKLSRVVPIYIMSGNHDAMSVQGGRTTVEVFGALPTGRVHYVTEPDQIPTPTWLRFWPVPYAPLDETRDTLGRYRLLLEGNRKPCEVLLLHQSILGCSHEGWKCDIGLSQKEARDGWDYTISGHFHSPQCFGKDKRGLYLGSPLHFRFDDAKRSAGYWIISFREDGSWRKKFVPSKLPRFHEVLWPEKAKDAVAGDYLKVTVAATYAEYAKLKPAVRQYVAVCMGFGIRAREKHRPIYQHTQRLKGAEKKGALSIMGVVDEYVKALDVNTNGLDAKLLRQMGRKAIESTREKD
jgi:DNA repair exonuclease SbcCD nuclease subunit